VSAAQARLREIRALAPRRRYRILNVCGGHERALTMAGLRAVLPDTIELIPGPGCPVCVCPEQDLHDAIALALSAPDITLLAFGDLLRAPVNVPKDEVRTLDEARAAGADVRPIASPAEALAIARREPGRRIVFLAAGFETTMAPVAALLARGLDGGGADSLPDNFSVLLAGRRTAPAVAMLLESGAGAIDALIAPGHVATVIGADEWRFVPERHGLPVAIAGFTAASLLDAILALLRQAQAGRAGLDNSYPESVRPGGNPFARRCLDRVMAIVDAEWRGIGVIPRSGYALRPVLARHDARLRHPPARDAGRRRAGAMPPGCDCAGVVLGRIAPDRCRLYGTACTPQTPVGPCMVSDEGACRIWWSAGVRPPEGVKTREVLS
jgi:hydrogenase expression/formation protein HypD